MSNRSSSSTALLVLLLGSLVLVLFVFRPLATPLFLAAVLASMLVPLHRKLSQALRSSPKLAGGTMAVTVVLLIFGPLVWLSALTITQAVDAFRSIREIVDSSQGAQWMISRLPRAVEPLAREIMQRLSSAGQSLSGGKAAAFLGDLVSTAGSFFFKGAVMAITFYLILVNRNEIVKWIDEVSPLRKGQTEEIIRQVSQVANAVLYSQLLTGLVQSALALVGFVIARAEQPLFFTVITFFASFIPTVGVVAVGLIVAALRLATGHPQHAIFLAAWTVMVVGLIDNVLKPIFIRGRQEVEIPGAIIFLALLGGLIAFGAVGLLIGPLAWALFIACHRIYQRDFSGTNA